MNLSIAISPIESFRNFAPFPLDSSLPTIPGGDDFDFYIRQAPHFQNQISRSNSAYSAS